MRSFKTRVLTAAMVAGALAVTSSPVAFAATDNPSACHGQTISQNNHHGINHSGENVGVGQVADYFQDRGLSFVTVKFLQSKVDAKCDATTP